MSAALALALASASATARLVGPSPPRALDPPRGTAPGQLVRPVSAVLARSHLGPGQPVEFLVDRLLYGACDWTHRFYVSVSPGRYRAHLALEAANVYDGQHTLAPLTTRPLAAADTDALVSVLGPRLRQHVSIPGQFSCFDRALLTRSKADRLKVALIPHARKRDDALVSNAPGATISRLLFEVKCDRARSLRPEPILVVLDGAGRVLFAHPPALLRDVCSKAFAAHAREHDASDANFRYNVRSDLSLYPRTMKQPPCADEGRRPLRQGTLPLRGLCPAPTARALTAMTSRDRIALALARPVVVTDTSWDTRASTASTAFLVPPALGPDLGRARLPTRLPRT